MKFFIFETLTGKRLRWLDPKEGSWSAGANQAEEVRVKLDLGGPDARALDWANFLVHDKHSIGVEVHGRHFGGPIMPADYDADSRTLDVTAKGIWSYFNDRTIKPVSALGQPLVTAGNPPQAVTAYDTTITNVDYGTIAKKLVQQACSWPGSNLPIAYQDDRASDTAIIRTYRALDHKKVGEALTDLTELDGGPDIRFQLRPSGKTTYEWLLETGSQYVPDLTGDRVWSWVVSPDSASTKGLTVKRDPTSIASVGWATAGRSDDSLLSASSYDPTLVNLGFPLREAVDTSHTSVSVQSTLQSYSDALLRSRESEYWTLKVRGDAPPYLADYNVGDLAWISVRDDPFIADGRYMRRISALSGDMSDEWIEITFEGAVFRD